MQSAFGYHDHLPEVIREFAQLGLIRKSGVGVGRSGCSRGALADERKARERLDIIWWKEKERRLIEKDAIEGTIFN